MLITMPFALSWQSHKITKKPQNPGIKKVLPVTEENPGEDGSPIIEFSDPKFLEALLRPCIALLRPCIPYPDMNGDGRISEKEAASIFAISCNSGDIVEYR